MALWLWMLVAATLCRLVGSTRAAWRRQPFPLVVSSLLRAVGAWLLVTAAAGLQAWWTIPLAALVIGAVFVWRPAMTPVADAALVALLGFTAVPALGPLTVGALSALYGMLAYLADSYVGRLNGRLVAPLAAVALAIGTAGYGWSLWKYQGELWGQRWPVLSMGIALSSKGQRVDLPTGAVAWMARPAWNEQPYAALFLHGAHGAGAEQPAAEPLRRALLSLGIPVLSLDHTGYGESPVPSSIDDHEAWDEGPHLSAALSYLSAAAEGREILVIGHSMGARNALHALQLSSLPAAAMIFGSSPSPIQRDPEYWHRRFHSDRGLEPGTVSYDVWRRIEAPYVGTRLAASLPDDHPPVGIIHFELEHDDVTEMRDGYPDALPGRTLVATLDRSHHYFNTASLRGVVLADVSLVRRLGGRMDDWLAELRQLSP